MTLGFVCGCAGLELTDDEKRFIADTQPWGLILFRRNVDTPEQVSRLTASFRAVVGRFEAPVLMDQEGGRVQRLRPPLWPDYPAASRYEGCGGESDAQAAKLGARLIAHELRNVGVTVDCAPVLDVPVPGSHNVIGDRAFAADPMTVARLGRAFAEGLLLGGVLPVMKHVPGHGRAGVDSHLSLPVVEADRDELDQHDFEPFRQLADLPIAMTAHVVYTALDPDRPATTSARVIDQIIRGVIGFDGLLLSDDLSMEALKGSLGERAEQARLAGCDILLHCNGKLDEARAVAAAARPIEGMVERRVSAAVARLRQPEPIDHPHEQVRLAAMVA
ncbi:beta-N-acetylhexosaminidase [Lichenihabitans psoromatis]|uniref:beta-N-acetylhexosaminidase n=1 Tax=Lichenihabitans psoromatis TaxID=2528642 RepID=UPI0010355F23|nr:beta-N-acetylhexosaminidase [Lichenihabitans psoromatis]